jgi:MscS family membrane protein
MQQRMKVWQDTQARSRKRKDERAPIRGAGDRLSSEQSPTTETAMAGFRTHRRAHDRRYSVARCVVLGLWLWTLPAVSAHATQPPGDELRGDVPRAAMQGYLDACRAGNYERAAAYLDLRGLPPATRSRRGPVLARQLKAVLDRTLWIELDQLSDAPEGDRDDALPPQRDMVGAIDTARGAVPILLERTQQEDGERIWQIASSTVAHIPALYDEFGYGRLGDYLPGALFEIRFLEVQLWQWLGLVLLVAVTPLLSWLATAVGVRLAGSVMAWSRTAIGDRALQLAVGPLRLLVAVLLLAAGTYPLGLAVPVQGLLGTLEKVVAIVAVTWLLVRLVGVSAHTIEERLVARGQAAAMSVVPLGRRTMQILVIALAVLAVFQNLGVNVTGIIAGLGIGGLAVALAAQKTVENLFGGVTLIADQPVRVGDFCRFGDRVGTVEAVGLRSTRVRTLDRTVVTIPNAEFSAMLLENFSQRDRIWFHPTISLRYETTPDQLRYVLVELKKLLVAHPKVDPAPARPRFVQFGAYSLDIEIFAYVLTSDINEFLAVQEDLLLRIMDIVEASGTGFAFPSQTIYAGTDSGVSAEKSRAAEALVRQWRAASALGLPSFKPEQLSELRATLEYPPRGSAVGA